METQTTPFPRAATRSWMEMPVRPWLAVALLMAIATVILTTVQLRTALRDRWLIQNGLVLEARVVRINDRDRDVSRSEVQRVEVRFQHPSKADPVTVPGLLPRKPGGRVALDDELTLRVDPANPNAWTERAEPQPLLRELTVPALMLAAVLVSLGVAYLKRSRVRKVLSGGTVSTGTVVSIKQSPLAPLSKQIGFTVDGAGPRVRQAYWPGRNGPIEKGDVIDVVASESLALPLRSYQ